LFRVVQRGEYDDLASSRVFRAGPNSTETKQFWTNREDAERFARLLETRWGEGPSWIVEVRVQPSLASELETYEMDSRPAKVVYEEQLDWSNDAMEFDLDA
jgi:hypothetical protein